MKKYVLFLLLAVFVLSNTVNALAFSVNGKEYFHPIDAVTGEPITTSTYTGTVIGDPQYNCYPQDAYAIAMSEPGTYILDVRTPCEWQWVGHPGKNKAGAGAALETPERKVLNIPWQFWQFDKKTCAFVNVGNEYFENDAEEAFSGIENVKVITMCRSGHRSVLSGEALEVLGIPAINMLDGFEGGTDANGYRTVNGWKVTGCPYNFSATGIYSNRKALK